MKLNKTFQNLVLFVMLAATILAPRLYRLGYYATADEPLYLKQSGAFYHLLSEGDFAQTDLIVHPGVLNLWSGAIGYFLKFPAFANMIDYPLSDGELFKFTLANDVTQGQLLAYGRAVSISIQTGLLLLAFYYLKRVFGLWPAVVGTLLVVFDPFYFANSRILQPDGMLSTCLFLSIAAYLSFRQGGQRWALVISGAAAGLGLLSKTTGGLLVPFIVLVETIDLISRRGREGNIKELVGNVFLWGIVAGAVFVALWPAMWVKPVEVVTDMIQSSLALSGEVNSPVFFNGEIVPDGEFGPEYWYFYFLAWLWRTTPLVMLGLVLGLIIWIKQQSQSETRASHQAVWPLLIFVGIFLLAMTLSKKKFDRYLLPVHLVIDLLAGLGMVGFLKWMKTWTAGKFRTLIPILAILLVAGQIWQTASVTPYYHSYYNPLLGGAPKAQNVMMIGWGEGLDEAARYLSKQPKANKLSIHSWYANTFKISYVYWSQFDTQPKELPISGPISDELFEDMLKSDYVVTYIGQRQRNSSARILDFLADKPIEHTVSINGVDYVYVYNMRSISQDY